VIKFDLKQWEWMDKLFNEVDVISVNIILITISDIVHDDPCEIDRTTFKNFYRHDGVVDSAKVW
jgi:hypothetical protein